MFSLGQEFWRCVSPGFRLRQRQLGTAAADMMNIAPPPVPWIVQIYTILRSALLVPARLVVVIMVAAAAMVTPVVVTLLATDAKDSVVVIPSRKA
jgi:hypothetical protein